MFRRALTFVKRDPTEVWIYLGLSSTIIGTTAGFSRGIYLAHKDYSTSHSKLSWFGCSTTDTFVRTVQGGMVGFLGGLSVPVLVPAGLAIGILWTGEAIYEKTKPSPE